MLNEDELKGVQWRSRRGMLELDVLLEPFTNDVLPLLEEDDQHNYIRLLECEDLDLFTWFVGGTRPEDVTLSRMIDMVLERGKARR